MKSTVERLKASLTDVEHDLKIAAKRSKTYRVGCENFADGNAKAFVWKDIYADLKIRKEELISKIKEMEKNQDVL